jgi:hypothetical protein
VDAIFTAGVPGWKVGWLDAHSIPDGLEELLRGALKTRNFLAHHFFRERAEAFMSWEGREAMVHELEVAQQLFESADDSLVQIVKPLRERYGLTDERLKPLEEDYLRGIDHDL